MENKYYVYQLRIEGCENPMYIGKGKGNRAYEHLKPSSLKFPYHKNYVIKKAQREGKEIHVEFLETDLNEDDAHYLEVWHILYYGRQNDGGCLTNHNKGGKGNSREVSEETRKKIAIANLNKPRQSEAQKLATSLRFKGKKLSPDHVEKGRRAKQAELNPMAKLTEDSICHIVILHYEGYTYEETAKIFNVRPRAVRDLLRKKTWYSVSDKYFPSPLYLEDQTTPKRRQSILSEENVLDIHRLISEGIKYKDIAKIFGITKSGVQNIRCGASWRDLHPTLGTHKHKESA